MTMNKGTLWVLVTTAWHVLRLWMEERPPIGRVAVNKLNKQPQTANQDGPPAWGLAEVLTTPPREKKNPVKKHSSDEMLPLETKQSGGKLLSHLDLQGGVFLEEVSHSRKRKREILLGTCNVRGLYRVGSLMAAARELGTN
jgi:hypothetical protein